MARPYASLLITSRLGYTEDNLLIGERVLKMFLVRQVVNPICGRRTTEFLMSIRSPVANLALRTLRITDPVSKLIVITMGRWRKARTRSHRAPQYNAERPPCVLPFLKR